MIGYTNEYLTHNGEPWFPVMGEIHYSRVPKEDWPDALKKMKAGGVTVASAYCFWLHHEEAEGEIDFSGRRNLRAFIECCKESGLFLMLRLGPWCHGEARNGGLPDWLLRYPTRTNDPGYLREAERYYGLLFEQAKGLLYKDGGPVIGVQIENEYGHCGGQTGEEGELHMRRLTEIAKRTGFDVPLYTATGWGGAVTGGLLPVMGGYCDAPWDSRLTKLPPSGNYVFTHERNDHNIGSDHRIGEGLTFDAAKFPYLTAELGGGLQVTRHRRPVPSGADIGATSLVKLGSGANLLGYYMYHGGTNPKGKYSTLQESTATGYLNDLPELSYDFHAPIREYGQLSDSYFEIRLLAMFLKQWGGELAKMPAHIPPENPLDPENLTALRWSVRHNGHRGFVFVNNHVRGYGTKAHKNARLPVRIDGVIDETPAFDVKPGDYFFYPINMPVHGGVIKWANATPLCVEGTTTVFYGDAGAVFVTEGKPDYKLISREEAKHYGEELSCSESPVTGGCIVREVGGGEYAVSLNYPEEGGEYLLRIDYSGESARAYIGGGLVADNFYDGTGWEIGLKSKPPELTVKLTALRAGDKIYLEHWPEMENGAICRLDGAELVPLFRYA